MSARIPAIAVAEVVSIAAAAVDGVVAVAPEPGHPAATYGPGQRVPGVQVQRRADGDRIVVHVAVALGYRLPSLAAQVRAAVAAALAEHLPEQGAATVDVHISQVVEPEGPGKGGHP